MSTHSVTRSFIPLIFCGMLAAALHAGAEESTPPSIAPAAPSQNNATPAVLGSSAPTPISPVPSAPSTTTTAPVTNVAPLVSAPVSSVRPLLRREVLGDYTLSWSDEFNADKLDTTLWEYRTDTKFWSAGKDANVTVSGGFLHIALKKEKAGKSDYTGGGIVSKRSFRYGYYEVSMKTQSAKGWHTSLWLTAHRAEVTGGRQEIDLCDTDSIDPKSFTNTLHQWKPIHRVFDTKRVKTQDITTDFHVWGCEFTPQKVRFFFDGEQTASMDAKDFVHDDQSIWLSCYAAPLAKTMHVEDDKLPAEVQVDWIRFYEKTK